MKDTKVGRYDIFPNGAILRLDSDIPLVWFPNNKGYPLVALMDLDAAKHTYCVHDIIGDGFLGPLDADQEWRHWDGDPWNNHVENLYKGTPQQNADDKARHGSFRSRRTFGGRMFSEHDELFICRSGFRPAELAQMYDVQVRVIYNMRNCYQKQGRANG